MLYYSTFAAKQRQELQVISFLIVFLQGHY